MYKEKDFEAEQDQHKAKRKLASYLTIIYKLIEKMRERGRKKGYDRSVCWSKKSLKGTKI